MLVFGLMVGKSQVDNVFSKKIYSYCSRKVKKYQKYLSKTKVKRRKEKVVAVTARAVSSRTLIGTQSMNRL